MCIRPVDQCSRSSEGPKNSVRNAIEGGADQVQDEFKKKRNDRE
jgi:hypothetical protein